MRRIPTHAYPAMMIMFPCLSYFVVAILWRSIALTQATDDGVVQTERASVNDRLQRDISSSSKQRWVTTLSKPTGTPVFRLVFVFLR